MSGFAHEVTVRYSDLDTYGHVNNATYGTYCEEARLAYLREVLDLASLDEFDAVLASFSVDFRAPATEPTSLDVGVWTTGLGESSVTMQYELAQDDRLVAEAETALVTIDPATREARPIPEAWRRRIADFEDLE